MRHRVRTRRLGVRTPHRKSMMRNMVTSLMEHGRIVTTITRAKELRRLADRMITLGKDGSLHARRQALSVIRDRQVVAKLFEEWSPRFTHRNGGYTRIVTLGPRRGDATMMAVIELAVDSLKPGRKRQQKSGGAAPAVESVIPAAAPESVPEVASAPSETSEVAEEVESSEKTVAAAAEEEAAVAAESSDMADQEAVSTAPETSSEEEGAEEPSMEAAAEATVEEETHEAEADKSEKIKGDEKAD